MQYNNIKRRYTSRKPSGSCLRLILFVKEETPINELRISAQEIVGRGYSDFWNSKKRYVVVKGGRASKKSTTAALKIIVRMMQYPESNTLVLRQTAESLKDSCFAQLQWAIARLGVTEWWKPRVSPLELEYLPTGQKILFRGLDNPLRVTSITVKRGNINFAWLEEAYEADEDAFDKIDQSLRGQMPEGYYIQWLITFNPWSSGSWLKSRFFDVPSDNILAMTTNYKCNEWLSNEDRKFYEEMKENDPEKYKIVGEGEWGLPGGQFFDVWRENIHVVKPFDIPSGWYRFRAMDWGSFHPYAVLWLAADFDGNLWVYRELYGWGGKPNTGTKETAKQVGEKIANVEKKAEDVRYGVLDSACWASTGVTGPTIAEELNNVLYEHGLVTFSKSSKGRVEGANALRERLIGYTNSDGRQIPGIRFFSNCINTIRTLPMLAHDKYKPETYDTTGEDHAVDAAVYACLSRPWTPVDINKISKKPNHDARLTSGWTM